MVLEQGRPRLGSFNTTDSPVPPKSSVESGPASGEHWPTRAWSPRGRGPDTDAASVDVGGFGAVQRAVDELVLNMLINRGARAAGRRTAERRALRDAIRVIAAEDSRRRDEPLSLRQARRSRR
jgi:hypothetical protein